MLRIFSGPLKLEPLTHGEALHKIANEMRELGYSLPAVCQPEEVLHAFRNLQQELIHLREIKAKKSRGVGDQ